VTAAPLRVLVVEDSPTVRAHLVEILGAAPDVAVVADVGDGRAAVEACQRLRPDVICMDMMLPGMNGLEATEQIMGWHPTPILIVSASTNRGELFRTYDALAAGAVDVLEKPRAEEPDAVWADRLLAAVRVVARVRVISHPRARLGALGSAPMARASALPVRAPAVAARRLVAIGASTGGPGAVVAVLRGLPEGFALPVLVVIHIGEAFAPALAEWLDGQVPQAVRHAQDGERLAALPPGTVLLAPPGGHLELRDGRLRRSEVAERHGCRPSVDVLFESVAAWGGDGAVAALLTGMGVDGAAGLLAIRQAGGFTIAQDAASSVVFGMPGEAVRLNAATAVLPLDQVAPAIRRAAGGGA
jgi:two-component system chemotaxis response regulator CheB